jgi:uncharacterized membrane-anchored protein
MDNDELARADRPRELVALIQRRSVAFLAVYGALAVVGAFGASGVAPPGRLDPVLLTCVAGFVAMFVLRRWHRRHYGDVRMSQAQRARGVLFGFAMLAAFVAMTIVGPRAVPSPLPFTFAAVFAAGLLGDPWRVSLQWLVVVAVLLWLSVIHVFGPASLDTPWAYSLLIGVAGVVACAIDHALLARRVRRAPGGMVIGGQHV